MAPQTTRGIGAPMHKIWQKSLPLFLFLILSVSVLAQTFRGTLSGTVVDPLGAVVGGAVVQLSNPATGLVQTMQSNSAGEFLFPELQVGTSQVTTQITVLLLRLRFKLLVHGRQEKLLLVEEAGGLAFDGTADTLAYI